MFREERALPTREDGNGHTFGTLNDLVFFCALCFLGFRCFIALLFRTRVVFCCPHVCFDVVGRVARGSTSGTDDGLLRAWALYWAATRPECSTYCSHDEVRLLPVRVMSQSGRIS